MATSRRGSSTRRTRYVARRGTVLWPSAALVGSGAKARYASNWTRTPPGGRRPKAPFGVTSTGSNGSRVKYAPLQIPKGVSGGGPDGVYGHGKPEYATSQPVTTAVISGAWFRCPGSASALKVHSSESSE